MNNTRGSVFVNMKTDQEKAYHKRKGTTASGMGGSGGTSDECGGRRVLANQCHVHVNDYHHHVITKLRRNTYILLILCNAASLEPSRRLFTLNNPPTFKGIVFVVIIAIATLLWQHFCEV